MVQISFYDCETGDFIKQWPNWTGIVPVVNDIVVLHYGDRNEEEREYVVHMRVIDGTKPDDVKLLIKQIS